ncbi:hypothetical protein FSP39_014491 [Pinctada imbricata]|uniref:SNF-related serine/threonine-protein kinase n=1 Tax=Pinctada imbricata TaxID=66713 RepID=A0AA89BSU3_PINIB|nr:hypothetical protein FSP39_014491 [Pinctada imbricata]
MDKKKFTSKKSRGEMDGKIAGLYDLEETIGKGHFAVVKLARHVFTNEKVAVKVIDKTKLDEVSKSHLFQEVRCMKLVQHPNVVRLYEVIDTQTKLYLILELGDGGDMYDYIMKHEKGLTEEIARRYFKQIVEAISYCHRLHVVHRDLKPENVVFFEKLGCVKLTDFGFSNMFNPGKKLETSCGSLAYSAPEILLGDSYDAPAVDVWSLGVILYMLVCGEPPFQEANDSETLTMIMDCKYSIPIHISTECNDLICRMLIRDPGHRACLEDIVSHPWLRSGDYIPPTMPLISREHLSDEDHNYLIDKMVEGNIATKDEVLQSLDKDLYDHITATYYLLAERKLKKQHMEHAATLSNLRKHSAPGEHPSYHHTHKPQLEPLALSPRTNEVRKTHTAPFDPCLTPPIVEVSPPPNEPNESMQNYIKSLNTSLTLDRKSSRNKLSLRTDRSGSIGSIPDPSSRRSGSLSPQTGIKKFLPTLGSIPDLSTSMPNFETIDSEGEKPKKGFAPISKIEVLKSFFERKIAALTGRDVTPDRKTGLFRLPKGRARKRNKSSIQTKDSDHHVEERPQRPKTTTSIVDSLLSPPGTHPSSSPSLGVEAAGLVPRKYSLIQEESFDDEENDEEFMDTECDLRPAKSAESLDDCAKRSSTTGSHTTNYDSFNLKRPLLSVASSPQLLNQICEENESDCDEEDDFVPSKLSSPRLRLSRGSCASPEVLRKYEQRKKRRGAGSRGTSCSSSDASDTDDTEGRSRKDKLKQKFMHRRDSSDHSSDTDGGPTGPTGGLGGSRGMTGGGGGGKERNNKDRKEGVVGRRATKMENQGEVKESKTALLETEMC